MVSSKSKSIKTKSSKGFDKLKKRNPSLVVPDAWINDLSQFQINDEYWQCYVVLLEEESTDASVYLEHFNEAAINGKRLAIKVISKLEIIKTVTEHMKESNPDREITPFSLLCSEIFNAAGSKFENKIPVELLAPLVKYMLLEYKINNKAVKEGLNEIQIDQEVYRQSLWQIGKDKPGSSKAIKSTKKDSLNTNKSKKNFTSKSTEKLCTKLRKRGEEWKDISWIEDAPIDGPQLYVTISTLFEPDLPVELLNFEIPLNAIIRLNLIRTPSFSESISEDGVPLMLLSTFQSLAEFKRKSTRFLSFNIGKHIDSEEIKKTQIIHFWNKINFLKTNKETAKLFENIMFLQFVPEHKDFEYQVQRFQEEIYRQVSFFLYDIYEITKQHNVYLNEMNIIRVDDTDICNLSDMFIYNSILKNIPQEVLNVPLILDALMAQVSGLSSYDKNTSSSKEYIPGILPLDSNQFNKYLFHQLDSLKLKYDLIGDSSDFLIRESTVSNTSENIRNLLIHGDEIRIKSSHLEGEMAQFVTNRTNYILRLGWKDVMLNYAKLSCHNENFIKLCNEIIRVEEESDNQGFYYFFYILMINSILNSLILTHSELGYRFKTLANESTEYKIDNLCEECLIDIANSGLAFKGSVTSFSPSLSTYSLSDEVIATNLFYIEEMPSEIILQSIQNVSSTFSNIESRVCPFTDQIVLLFHNLVNPRTLDIDQMMMGKITTCVPIRDFVDYIINEEEDWLKAQSNCLNHDNLKQNHQFSSSVHDLDPVFTLMIADLDFISHRSLKYQTIIKQNQKKTSSPKIKSSLKSPSKSSKKSNPNNMTKISKKSKDEKTNQRDTELDYSPTTQQNKLKFLGFDLGDPIRFQYNGRRKDIILDDDCKVILNTTKLLYGDESHSANVHIFGHDLYMHLDHKKIQSHCPEESFHLILSSGIILYFSMSHKNFSLLEVPNESNTSTNNQHHTDTFSMHVDSSTGQADIENENIFNPHCTTNFNDHQQTIAYTIDKVDYSQIPTLYNLSVSMPSGLHTELVKHDDMLYIRQTLLTKGPLSGTVKQEKYRCCLPEGYIIKSMLNGDLYILCANGGIFHVFKDQSYQPKVSSSSEVNLENTGVTLISENNFERDDKSAPLNNDVAKGTHRTNKKKRKGSNEWQKENTMYKSIDDIGKLPTIQEDLLSSKTFVSYNNYKFVGSNGECVIVLNGQITNLPSLFVSSSADINNNCINCERIDGVKSKHLADGSLMVEFQDGSCITSTPIESNQLFSVWTPAEFEEWFMGLKEPGLTVSNSDSINTQYVDGNISTSNSFSDTFKLFQSENKNYQCHEFLEKISRHSSTKQESLRSTNTNKAPMYISSEHSGLHIDDVRSQNQSFRKPCFIDDSFVVYNMSYLIEHPNYSSVLYDAQNCDIEFKFPISTYIKLKQNGSYSSSFEGANLSVHDDSIDFSRTNKDGTLRTITINTTGSSISRRHKSLPLLNLNQKVMNKYDNSNAINNEQISSSISLRNLNAYKPFFLYSIDSFNKEIFIDYDFKCYEIPMENICNKTVQGNDFSCFVINKDLSGFRLVSDNEVDNHVDNVTKAHGIVIKNESKCPSLMTILPMNMNESERWLIEYNKNISKQPCSEISSTFGKRESWIHPFVEPDIKEPKLNLSDAIILRLLHRIPTDKNTLSKLTMVLEKFKKPSKHLETNKIDRKVYNHDINLNEILKDPSILFKIYDGEMKTRSLLEDKSRKCITDNLMITIIHQACIKARKRIIKNKENELKTALRNNKIPPYHSSCFGQVLGILDNLVGNVITLQSPSDYSVYERVNCIIDEILEFSTKSGTNTGLCYSNASDSQSIRVQGFIDEIFQNIWTIEEENIQLTRILEKPIELLSTEEIEFLCSQFESRSRCPNFYIEDIIMKDILEARLQLSHYFRNLKEISLYYKSRNVESEIKEGQ